MWLVYLSSKKKFINKDKFLQAIEQKKPIIAAFWHNRLVMMPFLAKFSQTINPKHQFMSLASHHGDGQFVGRIMKAFSFQNIYGSSRNGRKKSRGIDLHSVREIIRGLRRGNALGITPDGPRGPNQKINGEIISMAKISGAIIIPSSYSSSRFIQFNSWDKFKMPLPFSTLCFYCDEFMTIDKNLDKAQEESMRLELEKRLNFAQEKSQELCHS